MSEARRIFILDDEPDMVKAAEFLLKEEGFLVSSETDPVEGLKKILRDPPDLVLLDVRMPEMDGFEVCKVIKADSKTRDVPVILVSIKTQESNVVAGLELGAEDYIRKPYHDMEFLARIRRALRRHQAKPRTNQVTVGPLHMDYSRYSASIDDKPLKLTPKEFELLAFLLRHEGHVMTRSTISQQVWKIDHVPTSRTIDAHVDHLRKKMGTKGVWIQALKGVGYRYDGHAVQSQ